MKEILNSEQKEAVFTTQGPLLIIAGPGSGKTKTLVARTIHLLENNVKPSEIFLTTFSRKAANELFIRITESLREKQLDINIKDMYIGTMHSIFMRLIEENIEYSNYISDITRLDDIDQRFFIFINLKHFEKLSGYKKFFSLIPCRNKWEKARKILEFLDALNENMIDLERLKLNSEAINFLYLAQIKYKELLISDNVIDFSNMQRKLLNILLNHPNVLEKLNEKIKYIMVDEYQDTNIIQEKIIFLLGENYKNICVVGDDDQSIYRFRGANVQNILNFPQKFENCKIINLKTNYRSELDIIRFSKNWMRRLDWNGNRYEKDINFPKDKPVSKTLSVIRIGGENDKKWCENIYKFISILKNTNKIDDYNQIAFLSHGLQDMRIKELTHYLNSKGINTYSPRIKNFYDKEEIKLIIGAILVFYPQTKILVFDGTNATKQIYHYYKNAIEELKIKLKDDVNLHKFLVKKRKEIINLKSYPNLKEAFYELLQFKTFKKYFEFEEKSELELYNTHNIAMFLEILDKYEKLTKISEINEENINKYLRYFFMTYLRYLYDYKKSTYENEENFPKNAIPFLTIHQSKGLEFPIVLIDSLYSKPYVEREKTYETELKQKLKIKEDDETLKNNNYFDFWRLYYVGFSRAKDLLVLTSPEQKKGNSKVPSEIFAPFFYNAFEWNDSYHFKIDELNISKLNNEKPHKFLSYSSNINLYDFCPKKYNLIRNFKFIPYDNKGIEYGVFFHKLLEKINNYIITNQILPADDIIDKLIDEVKIIEKDKVLNFNIDSMKKSAEKYLKYTNLDEIKYSEYKVYNLEKDYVLEGVIDLVKETKDTYDIVDFKTGKYNKNQTKNYKRQLAIYKYLLSKELKDKEIRAFLYFDTLDYPYLEVKIDEQNISSEIEKFNNTTNLLLSNVFPKRTYDKNCEKCEFKYLCKEEN